MRMNGSYLLDTNIVIAFFRQDPAVLQHIATAKVTFLPCVALGELNYGALNSGKPEQNLQRLIAFTENTVVLGSDAETAIEYGTIKRQLKQIGRLIPDNDIWIAAIAIQHHLTLATRDSHFQAITGLQCENW